MIQTRIERYLRDAGIAFAFLRHPRAVTAQETAEAEGISGWQLGKCLAVELGSGEELMCVVPAPSMVDLDAVCDVTGSRDARLVEPTRLLELFPGCEPGAAPPLGGLWNLPVILERAMQSLNRFFVPGGDHETLLLLSTADFIAHERPLLAPIATLPGEPWSHAVRYEGREPHPWHHP